MKSLKHTLDGAGNPGGSQIGELAVERPGRVALSGNHGHHRMTRRGVESVGVGKHECRTVLARIAVGKGVSGATEQLWKSFHCASDRVYVVSCGMGLKGAKGGAGKWVSFPATR